MDIKIDEIGGKYTFQALKRVNRKIKKDRNDKVSKGGRLIQQKHKAKQIYIDINNDII